MEFKFSDGNFNDILREVEIEIAKGRLAGIFFTIHQALVTNQKQDLIDVLQILINVMSEYKHLAISEEIYQAFLRHIADIKLAVESPDRDIRQRAWGAIEHWRKVGKPSFIMDFMKLKSLAAIG